MSDPKRWADDGGDATAFERELFRSGRAAALPPEEKRRQWLAIAEQAALIPAAGAPLSPHGVAGKAAAKGLAGTGWLKAVVLVPALAGAGAGVYALTHSEHAASHLPARPAPHVAVVATASPDRDEREAPPPAAAPELGAPGPDAPRTRTSAGKATGRLRERVPAAQPAEAAVSAGGATVTEATRASRLAEEARAVLDARNALRAGNPSSALGILDDARARFPDGALGQEREALTIDALARAGRKQAASARARAFLARFPNSPLASNVRQYE
jgi:hypothetical protein